MIAESRSLASKARESSNRFDYGGAMKFALSALPSGNGPTDRPIVPEAVGELYNAALHLHERAVFHGKRNASVRNAVFTPDERFVLTLGDSSDGPLQVWEPITGRLLQTFDCNCYIGDGSFSRDGTRLVLWERTKPILHVYKIFSRPGRNQQVAPFHLIGILKQQPDVGVSIQQQNAITYAEFDRFRESIVSSSLDGTARLWDALKLSQVRVFRGHEGAVVYASALRSGEIVTLTTKGIFRYFERRAETATKTVLTDCKGGTRSQLPVVSSDLGTTLLILCDDNTILVSKSNGSSVVSLGEGSYSSSGTFTSGGARVALVHHITGIDFYDTDGRKIWEQDGYPERVVQISARKLENSNGEPTFFVSASDRTAIVWSVYQNKRAILTGHAGELLSVSVAPKTDSILTGSNDGTARLWSIDPVSITWNAGAQNWNTDLTLPKIVLGGETVRIVGGIDDVRVLGADGRTIADLGNRQGRVVANCLSPSGSYLAIGIEENKVEIWSVRDWLKITTLDFSRLRNEKNTLNGITISPDGKSFVASFFTSNLTVTWPTLDSFEELITYAKSILPAENVRVVDAH